MKSRRRPLAKFKSDPLTASAPGVPPPVSRKAHDYLTKQWLDEVAAGTEQNIRDTPAWKEAVRRLGLKEVRRRLRLGCLASQCPDGNPKN